MASGQRLMMYLTPIWLINLMCRFSPKMVIALFCHWINEKNIDRDERRLVPRKPTLMVNVAKKMSKLSVLNILILLKQDEKLWKLYLAGVGTIPLANLPYILLELIYELGGEDGRKKVREVIQRSRQTLGGRKQGNIMENFKADTVIDIFENFAPVDVRMRLMLSEPKSVAFWLDHWDMQQQRRGQPNMKSSLWLGQLTGERAYEIQRLMTDLEFRRKYHREEDIYEHKHDYPKFGF